MNLPKIKHAKLAWLARQSSPVWGGHLWRGTALSDPDVQRWLDNGLIKQVSSPCPGYVITPRGRDVVANIG